MSEQKEACVVLCTWPVRYIFHCGECYMWQYSEEKSRAYNRAAGYCPRCGLTFADEYGADVGKGIRAFDDLLPEGESSSSD